jgi:hypothetical protein
MSEMVKRVTREIWVITADRSPVSEADYDFIAEAAIKSMRKPTEKMLRMMQLHITHGVRL